MAASDGYVFERILDVIGTDEAKGIPKRTIEHAKRQEVRGRALRAPWLAGEKLDELLPGVTGHVEPSQYHEIAIEVKGMVKVRGRRRRPSRGPANEEMYNEEANEKNGLLVSSVQEGHQKGGTYPVHLSSMTLPADLVPGWHSAVPSSPMR